MAPCCLRPRPPRVSTGLRRRSCLSKKIQESIQTTAMAPTQRCCGAEVTRWPGLGLCVQKVLDEAQPLLLPDPLHASLTEFFSLHSSFLVPWPVDLECSFSHPALANSSEP